MPTKLREAGAQGKITPELIFEVTVFPWCNNDNAAVHVSTLSKQAKRIVEKAIPWVCGLNM